MTTTLQRTADTTEEIDRPRTPATLAERIALAVVLIATAVMYLWNITVNDMGNKFYAGAAQAGSKNWEALLFGSLDQHNFITVDKPPLSQWVMGLSGQIFGFSSASMLVPEALMAVAAVALLYGAVSRISGRPTALLAGALLALTPVAVLMFRFNNPDAAMVLLMMAGAYCTVRALQRNGARWMALAGVALGLAFLAKMLEGLLVAPALGLAYLIAAPNPLRSRIIHLLGMAATLVVSSGWFVLLTMVWPASSRPYIAGSADNSFMDLVLGYNGFSRVLGHNRHPNPSFEVAGNAATSTSIGLRPHNWFSAGQSQGLARLFSGEYGFEIAWLLPAALLATVLVIIARRSAPRTDLVRAGAILFGSWIVLDGLLLSYMQGFAHYYYSLSIAPAVAGMFAIGVGEMWRVRATRLGRFGLAAIILTTGIWSAVMFGRNGGWLPALRWTILALAIIAAVPLLASVVWRTRAASPDALGGRRFGRIMTGSLTLGLIAAMAGPAAYSLATIGQPHTGGMPMVGPPSSQQAVSHGRPPFGGGWDNVDSPELDALLRETHTDWSAAIAGSSAAAGLELSTNTAVMAIGGFSGNDPTPTLNEFISDVQNHRVGYYIVPPNHGPDRRDRGHADIVNWVSANFKPTQVGSATVYNLSAPK